MFEKIKQWHHDRNLIIGSTDQAQYVKLLEEMVELGKSLTANQSPIDDIGDIMVVLVNIAERNGLTMEQCLLHAWNEIKDRRGRMVDGFYVKEQDYPA